jgi:hypothetical protein
VWGRKFSVNTLWSESSIEPAGGWIPLFANVVRGGWMIWVDPRSRWWIVSVMDLTGQDVILRCAEHEASAARVMFFHLTIQLESASPTSAS